MQWNEWTARRQWDLKEPTLGWNHNNPIYLHLNALNVSPFLGNLRHDLVKDLEKRSKMVWSF